jgi:hypothetical protein
MRYRRGKAHRARTGSVRYASVDPGFRSLTGHGRGRKRPRTGPVGAVTPTVQPGFPASEMQFQDCLLLVAVALITGVLLGVLDAESVGDALVGGVGLPVDAVVVAGVLQAVLSQLAGNLPYDCRTSRHPCSHPC